MVIHLLACLFMDIRSLRAQAGAVVYSSMGLFLDPLVEVFPLWEPEPLTL